MLEYDSNLPDTETVIYRNGVRMCGAPYSTYEPDWCSGFAWVIFRTLPYFNLTLGTFS